MRMATAIVLLATGGCVLSQFRQRAVEYSLNETANSRDEIVAAAKATHEIAKEIETAVIEERQPDLGKPVRELATALSAAHGHAEEAGKMLAVVQEDFGRPQTPAPATPEAADAMRAQYRSASRMWKMAMSWAKSKIPLLSGASSATTPAAGGGWTPTGIAGLVSAIVAVTAGLGEGTRRGVKSVRRRLATKDAETNDARAEAEDAMRALDEIKKTNADAVRKATNSKKHPDLRRAYVRREATVV
jgi:chromosome segregation ATPase